MDASVNGNGATITKKEGNGPTWTVGARSATAGTFKISFQATLEVTVKNKETNETRKATLSGEGEATLKVTDKGFQIVLEPTNNFPGHSESCLGICETGRIAALPILAGTTVSIVRAEAEPAGTIKFDPPATTNAVSLGFEVIADGAVDIIVKVTAKVKYVNSTVAVEEEDSIPVSILEPSGGGVIRDTNIEIYHRKGITSTGFWGVYYFTPSNVSFAENVWLWEKDCLGEEASGYFTTIPNGHDTSSSMSNIEELKHGISPITGKPNSRQATTLDYAGLDHGKPIYEDSYLVWNIPIAYSFLQLPGNARECPNKVKQTFKILQNGTAIVTKVSNGYAKSAIDDENTGFKKQ